MQSTSDNSFIPKRKNTTIRRVHPGRKILVLTIVAYSLLFAALLAAGGTFLYKNFVQGQLENEVVLLDGAVNTFSVQDFARVQEFNDQLQKATDRIEHSVSVVAILDEIEQTIAQPIQIQNLALTRDGDDELKVVVRFVTDAIDAAMFQRKVLRTNSDLFTQIQIAEINLSNQEASADASVATPGVEFVAEFVVPVQSVRFDPSSARRQDLRAAPTGFISTTPSLQTQNDSFNDVDSSETEEFESDIIETQS